MAFSYSYLERYASAQATKKRLRPKGREPLFKRMQISRIYSFAGAAGAAGAASWTLGLYFAWLGELSATVARIVTELLTTYRLYQDSIGNTDRGRVPPKRESLDLTRASSAGADLMRTAVLCVRG